jgi:hypothetical protein
MAENYITYDQMTFEEQREYIWGADLNKLLVRAYNIIFNEDISPIGGTDEYNKIVVMTAEQKQYLNELIENALELAYKGIDGEYPKDIFFKTLQNQPENLYKCLLWGMGKYFYEISKNKQAYKNYIEKNNGRVPIFSLPDKLKSRERGIFKLQYSGTPEQIYAAYVYYIINFAIHARRNNNSELYGKLLIACGFLVERANKLYSATKGSQQAIPVRTQGLDNKYKEFKEKYIAGNYSSLKYPEKIEQIKSEFLICLTIAKRFYKNVRAELKKFTPR